MLCFLCNGASLLSLLLTLYSITSTPGRLEVRGLPLYKEMGNYFRVSNLSLGLITYNCLLKEKTKGCGIVLQANPM
jgi:hypothetical protein